ncbi:helix-turn-helix domain-containing protein [Nitratireductor kimnyeongensis]|uniref:Helix-turn-helix domain-containing protein n=1 Tax=Nitratireductor kimnyeongensis TaxID=430679 RepID=A0ABW0T7X1_9HYPH|nr:XRE family transcriptional regulator [Nitratireductor kimnyeongensis]QZZ36064.1 XRE family transcriptional regulator [Nitratireductor kimnyeongensis]
MDSASNISSSVDQRISERLRGLRQERGWSLDDLGSRSGVSRATLSRLENAEVSATANVLGRLCQAYGITLSRLMHLVEDDFPPFVPHAAQTIWEDAKSGFSRRIVSPPARALAGEAMEGMLRPGARITYEGPPRAGLEHHLVLLEGGLHITVDGAPHTLHPGDCLRYQLRGPSRFQADATAGARYLLFTV